MQKKVLLAKDLSKNTIGILSLESEIKLKGTLKLFDKKKGVLILKIGENILAFDGANENFEFETIFHDLNLPICAMVCDDKILVTAKSENFNEDFGFVFEEFKKIKANEKQNIKDGENSVDFKNAKNEVKKLEKNKKNDVISLKNEKINKNMAENIDETQNFFEEIKEQFDTLFASSKPFLELEEKIENSKWVKVMSKEKFSNHYILGKIFDGENLTHICFGTPAESDDDFPDEEFAPYVQWLPFEIDGVKGSGYFVTYQDAKTGENILIN